MWGCNPHPKCPTCKQVTPSARPSTARAVYNPCVVSRDTLKCPHGGTVYCCCPQPVTPRCQSAGYANTLIRRGSYTKRNGMDIRPAIKPSPRNSGVVIKTLHEKRNSAGPSTPITSRKDKETFVDKPIGMLGISETAENTVPEAEKAKAIDKIDSDDHIGEDGAVEVYSIESVNSNRFDAIGDHEYVHFLLRITEDILRQNLYSDGEMQSVFDSHVRANTGRLDPAKMQKQIDYLKIQLNSPKFGSSTTTTCVQWDNEKQELILTECPMSNEPQLVCGCLHPHCSHRNDTSGNENKFTETPACSLPTTKAPEKKEIIAEEQDESSDYDDGLDDLHLRLLELGDSYHSTSSLQKKELRKQNQSESEYVVVDGPILIPKKVIENEDVAIFVEEKTSIKSPIKQQSLEDQKRRSLNRKSSEKGDVAIFVEEKTPIKSPIKQQSLEDQKEYSLSEKSLEQEDVAIFVEEKTPIKSPIKEQSLEDQKEYSLSEKSLDKEDVAIFVEEKTPIKSPIKEQSLEDSNEYSLSEKSSKKSSVSISDEEESVQEERTKYEPKAKEPDQVSIITNETAMIEKMLFADVKPSTTTSKTVDNSNFEKIFDYEIFDGDGEEQKAVEDKKPELCCQCIRISPDSHVNKRPPDLTTNDSFFGNGLEKDVQDSKKCYCPPVSNRNGVKIQLVDDDAGEVYVMLQGPVYVPKSIAETKTTPILIDSVPENQDDLQSRVNLYKPKEAVMEEDNQMKSISGEIKIDSISEIQVNKEEEETNSHFVEKLKQFEIECKKDEEDQKKLDLELEKYTFKFDSNEYKDNMYHFLLIDVTTSMTDFNAYKSNKLTEGVVVGATPSVAVPVPIPIPIVASEKSLSVSVETVEKEFEEKRASVESDLLSSKTDEAEFEYFVSGDKVEEEESVFVAANNLEEEPKKEEKSEKDVEPVPVVLPPPMKHRESILKQDYSFINDRQRPKSTSFQVETIEMPLIAPKVEKSSSAEIYVRQRIDSLKIEKEMSRRNLPEDKTKELPIVHKNSSSDLIASMSKIAHAKDDDVAGTGSAQAILAKLDKIPSNTSRHEDNVEQVKDTLKQFRTIDDAQGGKFNLSELNTADLLKHEEEASSVDQPRPSVTSSKNRRDTVQRTESVENKENCLLCCGKKSKK